MNGNNSGPRKFSCEVYLKVRVLTLFLSSYAKSLQALLSVFAGRTSRGDKDTAVERCEFEVHEDSDVAECRLVIRMICGLG